MELFGMRRRQASAWPQTAYLERIASARRRARRMLPPVSSLAGLLALAVCAAPCLAGTVRQLSDQRATTIGGGLTSTWGASAAASLDDSGTAVYVNASTNQLRGNPEHRFQVFRFDAAAGVGQQITHFSKGVSNQPQTVSVSDDNQWIAFVSRADPIGQNHDASFEVFVMHPDGTGIAQVTNNPPSAAADVTAAVLSGSANRIAFISRGNLLGTNPTNRAQLFAINVDGTGLRQLTGATTTSSWFGVSVSDDGQRIVFGTNANLTGGNASNEFQVFAVQADGTNLRQITSSPSGSRPVVSGNGSKIAWENSNLEIDAINWDGTGFKLLTPSTPNSISPSITDDGQFVFFSAYAPATGRYEIWKVKTDATGLTQITSAGGADLNTPVVSGDGGRVAFEGSVQMTSALDGSGRLEVMTGSGASRFQLMTTTAHNISAARITRDGTRIVFMSDMDPFGTNPDGGSEIFRMQADGTGLFQVTHIPSGDASNPSITADGNTIVFDSSADIEGQNPAGTEEIFRINSDGTGVQRLTSASNSFDPVISANGSVVVYASLASGNSNVGVVNANGTGQFDLTSDGGSWQASVDDSGTWVALQSVGNLTGDNTHGTSQIYRMRTNGTGLQRVSADVTRLAYSPDISGSGTRIVYTSNADPVGSNPSHLSLPFTYDTMTSQTWQVTTGTGVGLPATISGDGNWVLCLAPTDWGQPNPNSYLGLYRIPATGGSVERIGAGSTTFPGGDQGYFDSIYRPRTDMTATRTVFGGTDDPTAQNPDYSYDLCEVDLTKEPQIRVSRTAPTLVSWDYEAGPIRYDVIRGDVANLAPGAPGTVNLGPVVCLENDSPDANTAGFEDAVMPPVGHAFFFLFRGSRGLSFGPGTWGQASGGAERVPGSGVCAP